MEEILHVIALQNKLTFEDESSLFLWAKSGFKCKSRVSFRWKNSDLPEVVREVLAPKKKSITPGDVELPDTVNEALAPKKKSSIYHEDIEDVPVKDLINRLLSVDIADSTLPSFSGNTCVRCILEIDEACQMPNGKPQEFCYICGRAGILIDCNNRSCNRKFCIGCITHFEAAFTESALSEILTENDWRCYVCERDPNARGLIHRRTRKQEAVQGDSPARLPEKIQITVLADSEAGLMAFCRAHLEVEKYVTNPEGQDPLECTRYSPKYCDFSGEDVLQMAADFVIGTCFVGNQMGKKESEKEFLVKFYRFLFRYDISMQVKSNVLFLFVTDISMLDSSITERVKIFLKIDPMEVKLGKKKTILVWNNLKQKLSKELAEHFEDNVRDEEKILYLFIKDIKEILKKHNITER